MSAGEDTVLVTGGSGFLGGWCVVALLQRGYRVRTTVRDLAREAEVRAAVGTQVTADDRLTVLAADLGADAGWAEAVAGCRYVLHVASPFPPAQPKDPDELIVPAREGTRRVLGTALDEGAERVVVTSSVAAVRGSRGGAPRPLSEEDWTDPDRPGLTPYVRSKTIAERAAWALAEERGARERLATVNPSAILGPPLMADDYSFSLQAVARLLGGIPGIPRIGFSFVDVRDVAELQLRAMTDPAGGGERFIAAGPFFWMSEVAAILREQLGEGAAKVPTRNLPDLLVRLAGLFDSGIRSVTNQLSEKTEYTSEKAESRLGWSQRPPAQMIADTGRALAAA